MVRIQSHCLSTASTAADFSSAFKSVGELLLEKSQVNIMDERRKSYFPAKQISLVTKLVLLTKNAFCYIQNIIMCTVLERVEESRASSAVYELSWQAEGSNHPQFFGGRHLRICDNRSLLFCLHYVLLFGTVFTAYIHMHKMLCMVLFPFVLFEKYRIEIL